MKNIQKIKTRTLEEYNLVKKIRKERKRQGIIKISRLTGIPTNTIRDWIYRGVKPKRLKKIKILPEKAKILSPELAYILGVIEGDGCLCKAKRRSIPGKNYDYILTLGVTDKDFADYFSKILTKWSSFKPYMAKRPPRELGTKDVYIVRLRSKDTYEFLFNYDLNTLFKSNKKIKCMFLRGFYDSEGHVTKNIVGRSIVVGVVNLKIMKLVRKLFKSMNIKISDLKSRKLEGFQRYYYFNISSTKALELFRDKIGFSIMRKQERLTNVLNQLPTSEEIAQKKKGYLNNRKLLYKFIRENPGWCSYDISKKIGWKKTKVASYLKFLLKCNLIFRVPIKEDKRNKMLIYPS